MPDCCACCGTCCWRPLLYCRKKAHSWLPKVGSSSRCRLTLAGMGLSSYLILKILLRQYRPIFDECLLQSSPADVPLDNLCICHHMFTVVLSLRVAPGMMFGGVFSICFFSGPYMCFASCTRARDRLVYPTVSSLLHFSFQGLSICPISSSRVLFYAPKSFPAYISEIIGLPRRMK